MNPLHESDRHAPLGEQVSALCDGHLPTHELDAILAQCGPDGEVQARWRDYLLIGEVLRGQHDGQPVHASSDFLQRLHARLDAEGDAVQPLAPASQPLPQVRGEAANDGLFRWKMVSGVASVVAVAALGWNLLAASGPGGAPGPQLAREGTGTAVVATSATPSTAAVTATGASAPAGTPRPLVVATPRGPLIRDAALERLLAEHRQHGGMSAFQTSTGFIRNATYDADAR